MSKTTFIKGRLHEQREFPQKTLVLMLKKGMIVEELDWDKKTEKAKIHRRFFVEKYKWFKKDGEPKHKYLSIALLKDDFKKSRKRKLRLIKKIISKQYPVLSYSFFNSIIGSTVSKYMLDTEEVSNYIKKMSKAIKEGASKENSIEGGFKLWTQKPNA